MEAVNIERRDLIIKEIKCKTAIGKCGFPGGGFAINPYVGCGHNCVYCYARFMKRFTDHSEKWGSFADVKINIAEILEKQMRSLKYANKQIYIGTVTDPYQPLEEKYELTRNILRVLLNCKNPISILTKSDLVLRDVDLLKKFPDIDVNFTINTFDEKWKKLVEPNSPSIKRRLEAIKRLKGEGIKVYVLMGPYWPFFTNPEIMFRKFKEIGVERIFTESLNTIGGNWTGVENVLRKNYPQLLEEMRRIFFNKKKFDEFYGSEKEKLRELSKKYDIPTTIYF